MIRIFASDGYVVRRDHEKAGTPSETVQVDDLTVGKNVTLTGRNATDFLEQMTDAAFPGDVCHCAFEMAK